MGVNPWRGARSFRIRRTVSDSGPCATGNDGSANVCAVDTQVTYPQHRVPQTRAPKVRHRAAITRNEPKQRTPIKHFTSKHFVNSRSSEVPMTSTEAN